MSYDNEKRNVLPFLSTTFNDTREASGATPGHSESIFPTIYSEEALTGLQIKKMFHDSNNHLVRSHL